MSNPIKDSKYSFAAVTVVIKGLTENFVSKYKGELQSMQRMQRMIPPQWLDKTSAQQVLLSQCWGLLRKSSKDSMISCDIIYHFLRAFKRSQVNDFK